MRFTLRKFLFTLTLLAVASTIHAVEAGKPYWVVARSGLNLRAEPSLKGARIVTIPDGEQVTFIEQKDQIVVDKISGYWWKVQWRDKTGFAFSGFLSAVKPLAVALDKPLQGQFTSACLNDSQVPPQSSCSGVCGEQNFLLQADGTFVMNSPAGCHYYGFPFEGKWKLDGNSIVLTIDEVKKCFNTCAEYCNEGVDTGGEPFDCKDYCPVKGKVPSACPAGMTREQYQAKFSRRHQVILQLNKKGEVIVKEVSKGLGGWKVGKNYGRLYEIQ